MTHLSGKLSPLKLTMCHSGNQTFYYFYIKRARDSTYIVISINLLSDFFKIAPAISKTRKIEFWMDIMFKL